MLVIINDGKMNNLNKIVLCFGNMWIVVIVFEQEVKVFVFVLDEDIVVVLMGRFKVLDKDVKVVWCMVKIKIFKDMVKKLIKIGKNYIKLVKEYFKMVFVD